MQFYDMPWSGAAILNILVHIMFSVNTVYCRYQDGLSGLLDQPLLKFEHIINLIRRWMITNKLMIREQNLLRLGLHN